MIKKFILFIGCLFFSLPVFADDSSIIPVVLLFAKNNFENIEFNEFCKDVDTIFEMQGYSYSKFSDKIIKTYFLEGDDTIFEMQGYSYSKFSDKITKTYFLEGNDTIFEMQGYSYSKFSDKITKTYFLE